MFSKKGKRKINVDGKIYYWCVTDDRELGCEPYTLSVFSESELLCQWGFDIENPKRVRAPEPNQYNAYYITGDHPRITPSVVREKILETLTQGGLRCTAKKANEK